MSDCLFCRLVSGEIPADVVRATETTLAFRDIAPKAPVHVLVIPKAHHATIADVAAADPALAAAVLTEAREVAVSEGVGDGYRLVANTGAPVGQTVFHAHLHVLGGGPIGDL
jgi:histidine triad (HIT) family protein